ncbi:MAG TPA: helix-turn-helix domain-containing protein [Mucilaginibacter sp.]|nr:helix-turn-helix domain-containing protein [Mucilaginibacter sp.]
MSVNLWSVLLVAFLVLDVCLIIRLFIRRDINQDARQLLTFLLCLIFCIQFSSFSEAAGLYRNVRGITNLSRGMILLTGPVLYLYSLSVLMPDFRFRYRHILHFIPYLAALITIWIQDYPFDNHELVLTLDAEMQGLLPLTAKTLTWFMIGFAHFSLYFFLVRRFLLHTIPSSSGYFNLSIEERLNWLNRLTTAFIVIAAVFVIVIIHLFMTGLYTAADRFVYSMALGLVVYVPLFPELLFWWKSAVTSDNEEEGNAAPHTEEQLLTTILYFFEEEQLFMNPGLRVGLLARKAKTTPRVISRIINKRLGKSFTELVSFYRIEEVKKRMADPAYRHYSATGIAMEVGFTSKSAFNEAFKRQSGMTPSEYLKWLEMQ